MKRFLAGVVALGIVLLAVLDAQAVTLVENHAPRARIVLPEKPSPAALQAAKILQSHIKQISGAELAIIPEGKLDAAPKQPLILLGEGRLTKELGFSTDGLGAGGFQCGGEGQQPLKH